MLGGHEQRPRIAGHRVPVASICVVVFMLAMMLNGCAADNESCPLPEVREGDLETAELAGGTSGLDDADASMPPSGSGASLPADGQVDDATGTSQDGYDAVENDVAVDSSVAPPRVDLVYFHPADACGCLAEVGDVIETAVRTYFPEEMEQKTVRFFSVISDDPANQLLVRMYESQPFDLFLVTYEGDKAEATQVYEIWNLLGDNEAIALAVKSEVADCLAQSAQLRGG